MVLLLQADRNKGIRTILPNYLICILNSYVWNEKPSIIEWHTYNGNASPAQCCILYFGLLIIWSITIYYRIDWRRVVHCTSKCRHICLCCSSTKGYRHYASMKTRMQLVIFTVGMALGYHCRHHMPSTASNQLPNRSAECRLLHIFYFYYYHCLYSSSNRRMHPRVRLSDWGMMTVFKTV